MRGPKSKASRKAVEVMAAVTAGVVARISSARKQPLRPPSRQAQRRRRWQRRIVTRILKVVQRRRPDDAGDDACHRQADGAAAAAGAHPRHRVQRRSRRRPKPRRPQKRLICDSRVDAGVCGGTRAAEGRQRCYAGFGFDSPGSANSMPRFDADAATSEPATTFHAGGLSSNGRFGAVCCAG